jgi:hypothetical protein
VSLWATFSNEHGGVDISGDRESLRALAHELGQGADLEVELAEPPSEHVVSGWRAAKAIRIVRSSHPTTLITLRRVDQIVEISGPASELEAILAGPIRELAEMPFEMSGVGTHLHVDPATDPDHAVFSPESEIEIAFHLVR